MAAMNGDADQASIIDTRLLGKVATFCGEETGWQDWKFQFVNYTGVCRASYADMLEFAPAELTEITDARLSQDAKACGKQIFYMLALLTSGPALGVVKSVPSKNGLEVWRRLVKRYEPQSMSRNLGSLQEVLGFRFTTLGHFEDEALHFGQAVLDYERLSDEFVGLSTLKAILWATAPLELRAHLQLNAQTYGTYEDMRNAIVEFIYARRVWAPVSSGGS